MSATGFTGSTLPIPAGTKTMLVAGLTPNAAYTVSIQPTSVTITPARDPLRMPPAS